MLHAEGTIQTLSPPHLSEAAGKIDQWDYSRRAAAKDLRVLVVEDDQFDFLMIKRALLGLTNYRADIDHASTVKDAQLAAQFKDYDVVFVDFCLGNDTGVLAMDAFGGHDAASVLILLSGMSGLEIQKVALQAGAVHCLNKSDLSSALLEASITSGLHNNQLKGKLRQTIKKLEASTEAKSQFFANMSHDLKTPLNAIMGYSEIMSENHLQLEINAKYAAYAQRIKSAGTHLLEVINNLVLHADDMDRDKSDFAICDLNDIVEKAIGMVSILAENKDIDIILERSAGKTPTYCQCSLITQTVINLLSNAIKYTNHCGTVEVTVSATDKLHTISVADNGIGMSAEDIEIALSPFGRCKLPPEMSQEGTGLGLPIVDKIMERHGGELDVQSSPGFGTSVTLRLPRANGQP